MSTEHVGAYCPVRDKMVLEEKEARRIAARLKAHPYHCPHCGGWHFGYRHMRQQPQGDRRTWKPRKFRK